MNTVNNIILKNYEMYKQYWIELNWIQLNILNF